MNQKIIMLMAAFSIIAIVGTGLGKVQAYTSDELSATATEAYETAKYLRVTNLAIETCTNQLNNGDYSNLDSCISIGKIMNNHMSQVMTEANSDIVKITGYGSVS